MSNASLQEFCNRIAAARRITGADVRILARDVLPEGIAMRDEADLLIALDRAADDADGAFAPWLLAQVVDFAVWGERPTGYVDRAVARWLAGSLGAGRGPTPTAVRIAREIVREAEASDQALVAFALGNPQSAAAEQEAHARAA